MESLIFCQYDIFQRMSNDKINFQKTSPDRMTKNFLIGRIERLNEMWAEFRTGHRELLQTCKPTTLKTEKYTTENLYDLFQEFYGNYKCELQDLLDALTPVTIELSNANNRGDSMTLSQVKLPKITIPTFSGKYTEWTTFRDLFKSMIDNNSSLDKVQKLQYLKGYLTGEAEQLVRNIPVSDTNYERCWKQLEERYNNKKYLSHCVLKRLLSQRSATTESATFLKDLLDTSSDCLSSLSNLGIDVSTWDILVIYLLTLKLDPESRKQWELNVAANSKSDDLPTFTQFKEFLTGRYRALEFIEPSNNRNYGKVSGGNMTYSRTFHAANFSNFACEFCGDNHKICFCKKFAAESFTSKHDFVTKHRICYNCLGANHSVRFCQKAVNCRICGKRHHSLLHPTDDAELTAHLANSVQARVEKDEITARSSSSPDIAEPSSSTATPLVSCFAKENRGRQILLPTALVGARSKTGNYQVYRALLDQGSQASFVTEATVQDLGLKKSEITGVISGIGGTQSSMISKATVNLHIQSLIEPSFNIEVKCYVLKNITTLLPGNEISAVDWEELGSLSLADPNYNTPNRIDILLGADVYGQILRDGVRRGPVGSPVAQCTSLGWILSGSVASKGDKKTLSVHHLQVDENEMLRKFWELESEPLHKKRDLLTEEEQKCEENFAFTTRRDEEGRYIVKLPFREEEPSCKAGNSREIAVKRFKFLERKLGRDENLKKRYTDVINEYLSMNHMVKVPDNDEKKEEAVYLPHHAVVREDRTTTKVRVVFDASCKNSKGVSLNDTLMIGPRLQSDLRHLIINWRKYPVCLVADIVKMYRMVKVTDEDADFQRIVWRDDPNTPLDDYKLLTVTFGTASAPYLAVKALNQVAEDYKEQYPKAAIKVSKEFYMDDLMTGAQTATDALILYKEMSELLRKGGFILQKWTSNDENLLTEINNLENIGESEERKILDMKEDNIVKILGVSWNRTRDEFQYSVSLPSLSGTITKRKIISDVSRLFDPLGWIAPCVVTGKTFIQKLWLAGTEWDEEPPTSLVHDWLTYREELRDLKEFCVPRWFYITDQNAKMELHGFSDASNIAYAAVVYLRVVNNSGEVYVSLVAAKTRLAPVKQISIPRLELCGAVLLVKLLLEVSQVLEVPKSNIRAWTDSTIVLAWLNKHPNQWKTFVANRVSEILTSLESSQWAHVSTKDNPADCASRGMKPKELVKFELWKFGPKFLKESEMNYTKLKNNETREEISVNVNIKMDTYSVVDKYSSLKTLVRVIAYCRRWITKKDNRFLEPNSTYLRAWELDGALIACIKLVQGTEFQDEIKDINTKGFIQSKSSKLLCLTPFCDDNGLLRATGRLSQSQENEGIKYPILLPHDSNLSRLIVADAHKKTLHGGAQSMFNYIRSAYWILGAKNLIKNYVLKCVKCIRHRANLRTQLMGFLPTARVTPNRAFFQSGVDYAGPISLKLSRGRGQRSYKGYICLFVCMVTKAIHIEVCSDLTSRSFLEAFKRFVSRRGHCGHLYSDNGTNFIGASRELKILYEIEKSSVAQEIAEGLANNGTTWHFIPPRAPNFGGLWEAGIKSTKFHIKRVIGDTILSYEEMTTLLNQIEACLNSRPLSMIPSDPGESNPLTPGHFLVGEPLLDVPEVNYENSNIGTLRRWQLTQRMVQGFWRRWSNEYLSHLLQRYKWSRKIPEPNVGDIVLIKEDDLPPTKWLFGRVVQKHPGPDHLTRVVTLKSKNSLFKRPTSKLCVLPITE